jgi:threonyl-tRNA synthetase
LADVAVNAARAAVDDGGGGAGVCCATRQTAHVMAMAVQSIFKEAKCTIGPWIEKGFYYDFAFENAFSDKDLKKIKKQMDKIIRKDLPLTKEEVRAGVHTKHQTLT